jgi:tRNA 2-thiouridine synthesizing protein E
MVNIMQTTPQGYLLDWQSWTSEIAQTIANQEQIELTPLHWDIIYFLREYYQQYQTTPPMRVLVKILQQNLPQHQLDSPSLYRLFPLGPVKQGCKIAGLPKPPHCI